MKSYIYLILLLIVLLLVWFFWWASTLEAKNTTVLQNPTLVEQVYRFNG